MLEKDAQDRRQFGRRFMEELHKRTGGRYRFEVDEFAIHRLDSESIINLANLYDDYCRTPADQRESFLVRLAEILANRKSQLPDDYNDVRPHLRPKIWLRISLELMRLELDHSGHKPIIIPYMPIGEHLCLTVVYDSEDSMQSISPEQIENWGVTFFQAMEDAKQNLAESTNSYSTIGDSILHFFTADNYDSSRIILTDILNKHEFRGSPIAIVPDRNNAFITGCDDEQALSVMYELSSSIISEADRPLSPLPLILVEDEWIDWTPPRDHPIRSIHDQLRIQFESSVYDGQQKVLTLLHESLGDKLLIAQFLAVEVGDDEELQSYCVWTEQGDALLPKTDLVAFLHINGDSYIYAWDDVFAYCNDLMVLEGSHYPPRYRVSKFPSSAQFKRMRAITDIN